MVASPGDARRGEDVDNVLVGGGIAKKYAIKVMSVKFAPARSRALDADS